MKKFLISVVLLFGIVFLGIVYIARKTNGSRHTSCIASRLYETVEKSKKAGNYVCEYNSVFVRYKSITMNVEAFAQHPFMKYNDGGPFRMLSWASDLLLKFTDERDMREIGYGKDWVINEEWNCIPTNAYYVYKEYNNNQMPPDTLFFFIREKNTSFDSLDCGMKTEPVVTWDTVQCFRMIKRIE